MTKIIGLSGSLRKNSFNTALLKAAASLMPAGSQLDVHTIEGIPLYNGDVEDTTGIPEVVKALKEQIAGSNGLLLSTPEYNNSLPGAFKNAIDWISRPNADVAKVFGGRPAAVIGASPGGFGTVLSQSAWLPVLRTLGTKPWWGGRLMVAHANKVFGPNGEIVDEVLREQLKKFLAGFVEFATANPKS